MVWHMIFEISIFWAIQSRN